MSSLKMCQRKKINHVYNNFIYYIVLVKYFVLKLIYHNNPYDTLA